MYGMKEVGPNRYRETLGRYFEDFEIGNREYFIHPTDICCRHVVRDKSWDVGEIFDGTGNTVFVPT